jgi:hypothetical protein
MMPKQKANDPIDVVSICSRAFSFRILDYAVIPIPTKNKSRLPLTASTLFLISLLQAPETYRERFRCNSPRLLIFTIF